MVRINTVSDMICHCCFFFSDYDHASFDEEDDDEGEDDDAHNVDDDDDDDDAIVPSDNHIYHASDGPSWSHHHCKAGETGIEHCFS